MSQEGGPSGGLIPQAGDAVPTPRTPAVRGNGGYRFTRSVSVEYEDGAHSAAEAVVRRGFSPSADADGPGSLSHPATDAALLPCAAAFPARVRLAVASFTTEGGRYEGSTI
jgi:hypothetical protein